MSYIRVRVGQRSAMLTEAEFVLGRSEYCSMLLDDLSVSRLHAVLWREDGRTLLRDLDSRNGTTVNGRRVRGGVEVLPGDEIRVGDVLVRLETVDRQTSTTTTGGTPLVLSRASAELAR
jgi:pSer/pThr/pTyr-binding forkhead associated (FHA) protein